MRTLVITNLAFLLLTSCSEINTTDPVEAYTYWSGTKPSKDIEIIEAKYWQSAHWTKEYILYLKIKPTEKWWAEFVRQNNLKADLGHWEVPTDLPEWFRLPDNVTIYKPENDFYDSRFFRDEETGNCYIYDIQL